MCAASTFVMAVVGACTRVREREEDAWVSFTAGAQPSGSSRWTAKASRPTALTLKSSPPVDSRSFSPVRITDPVLGECAAELRQPAAERAWPRLGSGTRPEMRTC